MTADTLTDALRNAQALVAVEDDATRAWATSPGALAGAAAFYASLGWPVFPVVPGGKTPLTARGFHAASTDAKRVAAWWRGCPDANIGLATGVAFDVLDVDRDKGGFESLNELVETWANMGAPILDVLLGIAETRDGGRHYYIPACPTATIGQDYAPGIDYRGKGGYVLAPPSRVPADTADGPGAYTWIVKPAAFVGAA